MTQQIEMKMDAEIVSVYGVVNGESYTFTLTGSVDGQGIWSAAVTRALDGIYRLSITAVNQRGTSSQLTTTIYFGLHLITDRTQFDVDRVKMLAKKGWANMTPDERNEWENGLKGAYNYTDLNRVESAMEYVGSRLIAAGYYLSYRQGNVWSKEMVPNTFDMELYLDHVKEIRDIVAPLRTTPPMPDITDGFNYIDANNIEQILLDADDLATRTMVNFVYSGDIFGGEMQ